MSSFRSLIKKKSDHAAKSGLTVVTSEAVKHISDINSAGSPSTDKSTDKSTDSSTDCSAVQQIDQQIIQQIDQQFDRQNGQQMVQQNDQQIVQQIDQQNDQQMVQQVRDGFYLFTEKQLKILHLLYVTDPPVIRLNDIARITGISYGTVRSALNVLVSQGCISRPVRFRKGQFHGISYTKNEKACRQHLDQQMVQQMHQQVDQQNDQQMVQQTDGSTDSSADGLYSSSSYTEKNNNNARARDGAEYFDGILSNDPEFLFWKKRGLTYKQICTWCEMADCDPGDMIEYLRYYRWDIVEEKLVEKKKIDDIFAWFSGVMKKSGTYRRPDKYKTWVEKDMARRAAEERRRMEERKEVIRLYGENMLAEPDTALYAKCHEMASTAMKRPDRIGGPGYRSEMIGRLEQFIDAHGFAEADRLRAIKIEKEEP